MVGGWWCKSDTAEVGRVACAGLGPTLLSCSRVIFFSPSNSRNDSKVGGAFIARPRLEIARECGGRLQTAALQPVLQELAPGQQEAGREGDILSAHTYYISPPE